MKPIALISGTNRAGNKSIKIARHLEKIYQSLGAETKLLDLVKLPQEVFHPEVYKEKPESLREWTEAVMESDGVVMVVPEYNGSYPGALKYFIDLLPFPDAFEDRPIAFVGLAAGIWGSLRAVEHLQGVVGYRNAHVFPKRVFLPTVHMHFDEEGNIQPELAERLHKQSAGFLEYIRRLRH